MSIYDQYECYLAVCEETGIDADCFDRWLNPEDYEETGYRAV